jgi:cation diffusion facilitator family transporter
MAAATNPMQKTASPHAGYDTHASEARSAAKSAAALSSVIAASGITLLKLITAAFTGSLGMFSEAAHSLIDLLASGITLLAVRFADRPADAEHTYGHGKLESISAGIEIVFMVVSCIWITYEALHRILSHTHLVLSFSIWPFLVLLLSIATDFTRARNLRRVAEEQHSQALEADALHFGTDLWASAAVLFGLVASLLGQHFGIARLEFADPIAALIVAAIILRVTWSLAHRTLDTLLDATPPELREAIDRDLRHDLLATAGVVDVDRIRVRRSGSSYFVDLALGIDRNLTFQRSEQITATATAAVQTRLPGADVMIHTVPTAPDTESVFDRIRAVAAERNLAIHDVSVQQYEGALHVEQHLEVAETMSLRQAHDLVTRLEADIHRNVPAVASVLTHIEAEPATIAHPAPVPPSENLLQQMKALAREFPEIQDIHEVTLVRGHGGAATSVQINCHCTLPDDLPMSRVHEIITEFESEFRRQHPQVARVLIHPEPATDNRR